MRIPDWQDLSYNDQDGFIDMCWPASAISKDTLRRWAIPYWNKLQDMLAQYDEKEITNENQD